MENRPNRIIWHHSADDSIGPQFEKIDKYHKSRGFPESRSGFFGGYHILIEKDGAIMRYREDIEIGAHDAGENINSLGVCLAGNFSKEKPTEAQEASFKWVLEEWMKKYAIPLNRIDPHRMGDATECPGKMLSDNYARELVSGKSIQMVLDEVEYHLTQAKQLIDAAR